MPAEPPAPSFVASFDVEEHDRIEAAVGLSIPTEMKQEYARRMEASTRRLLDELAQLEPFLVKGRERELLELPPVTLRIARFNLPVAGGGYFRLFPPGFMRAGLRQVSRTLKPSVGMLYFHPWEFDVDQPRLPLRKL